MTTITVNIAKQTVTMNGQTCNFYEAGLINSDGIMTDHSDIVAHFEEREGECKVEFEGSLLGEALVEELAEAGTEPDVTIFADESSIFWVTKAGQYIWLQDHQGLKDYVDENHQAEERKTPEGVGSTGVEWKNTDFENPFHISDFLARIETITVNA